MRSASTDFRSRPAFTLIEIMVVILIIGLLIAILIPSLKYAKRQAEIAATQALLNSITTGIEDYYSTAEFGKIFPSSSPGTFGAGGTLPIPVNRGSVMLAEALTGFLPYATDGAGYDTATSSYHTYQSVSDPVYGFRLHVGGHGNLYGPYARTDDPMTFRQVPGTTISGTPVAAEQVFIDRWGNEILYYQAVPTIIKNRNGLPDQPRQITSVFAHWTKYPTPPDATFTGIYVLEDNPFVMDKTGTIKTNLDPSASTDASFWKTLGCSSPNTINAGDVVIGADSYLLLSAGQDGVYFTADDIIQVHK